MLGLWFGWILLRGAIWFRRSRFVHLNIQHSLRVWVGSWVRLPRVVAWHGS